MTTNLNRIPTLKWVAFIIALLLLVVGIAILPSMFSIIGFPISVLGFIISALTTASLASDAAVAKSRRGAIPILFGGMLLGVGMLLIASATKQYVLNGQRHRNYGAPGFQFTPDFVLTIVILIAISWMAPFLITRGLQQRVNLSQSEVTRMRIYWFLHFPFTWMLASQLKLGE